MTATHELPMPHLDGVEHRYEVIDGVRIHYAEAGEGDPVVLVHGWPQHWWAWREIIGPLATRHRVICPDIRGLGWSEGSDGSFRWDALAGDLFALLDELGLDRVRLVTHDWGTVIGYRACLMRPKRFERFVAMTAIHMWQAFSTPPVGWRRPWHVWTIALLGAPGITRLGLADRALRVWRHVGAFNEDEAAVYLGPLRRPSSIEATVRFDRAFAFYELARIMREYRSWRLRVPTLHLYGREDPLTPAVPESYRRYTDAMTVEIWPECGHFIPEEAPDRLLKRLEAFF